MADTLDQGWRDFRCCNCRQLLFKRTSLNPLKNGEKISVKCGKCNAFTFLIGQSEELSAQRSTT